ncbi:tRNA pseudouridine synthase D TruD [Moraxella macacae 0408225]|uniref:tRNA pseudouridine synthase D n=1 Tax=Moraxella macacae 0408225 TaxID=1230338 RepID=L2F5S0_9GAMM|nr:tRNA pseudouridine(13) synthase TruD [Moraxella macacae]ELA08245.1 tRNA pseudouridine synthase D TruD [Moraxella macacae 0408225]
MLNLANPYKPSIHHAIYKQTPQDFIVHEQLSLDFANHGEHLWLQLKKTNLNTEHLVKLLAKWADIAKKDIGFSGLKDRHAITTQWFSLRLPKKSMPTKPLAEFFAVHLLANEQVDVLNLIWHNKKLNRSTHEGNRFIITLRQVHADKSALDKQLLSIKTQGVPNYFGEQRFGHEQQNLLKALHLFKTELELKTDKPTKAKLGQKFGLYLSSARSELFNAILAKRVVLNTWQTAHLGDVMNLAGSQSIFIPDAIDDKLQERLLSGDIHLTGAMWGFGKLQSFADVAKLEQTVIDSSPTYQILAKGLASFGLKQQRRPLRVIPKCMSWQWLDCDVLTLDFVLPTGSFATVLLHCLVENLSLVENPIYQNKAK